MKSLSSVGLPAHHAVTRLTNRAERAWGESRPGAPTEVPRPRGRGHASPGKGTVIGLNLAPWSSANPGRVASPLDDAPPGASECSSTVTSSPARARLIAQTKPADPAPITATRLSLAIAQRHYPEACA